jgi:hypothetical protein
MFRDAERGVCRKPGGEPPTSRAALQQASPTPAALGAQPGTATRFARLLVIFATAHLFLDPTSLDQLAEATHGFLD